MEINLEITKSIWQNFLNSQKDSISFMQSWEWGEFKKSQNEPPLRFIIEDQGQPILGGQLLKITVPLIKKPRLYCPLGPIGDMQNQTATEKLFDYLDDYAHENNILTVDLELPFLKDTPALAGFVEQLKQKKYNLLPITIQPRRTAILDLTQSEEKLLAACKPKTRYNIRLAQRKNVKVKTLEKPHWDGFYKLLQETAERQQVTFYPQSYFENMEKALGPADMLTMLEAYYEKTLVASLFVIGFRETATYLFGASSDQYRNTMANYLLHWEAIRFAQQKGYQRYDFWGISDGTAYTKSWQGITRFKQGFAGQEIEYAGFYRKVFNPLVYSIYNSLQRLRQLVLDLKKKF